MEQIDTSVFDWYDEYVEVLIKCFDEACQSRLLFCALDDTVELFNEFRLTILKLSAAYINMGFSTAFVKEAANALNDTTANANVMSTFLYFVQKVNARKYVSPSERRTFFANLQGAYIDRIDFFNPVVLQRFILEEQEMDIFIDFPDLLALVVLCLNIDRTGIFVESYEEFSSGVS